MQELTLDAICSAARRVPLTTPQPVGYVTGMTPERGDVVVGKLTEIGHHDHLEVCGGRLVPLRPGMTGAFVLGSRYSTIEFHGEVPRELFPGTVLHLLNTGGAAGWVLDRNRLTHVPTEMEFVGYAVAGPGKKLSLTDYRLETKAGGPLPTVILVVGADMEVGKTTAAASAIRMLSSAGHRTAGVKLTGTTRMKDLFVMQDAGGDPTLDFVDFGLPSTFGAPAECLTDIFHSMRRACGQAGCEFMVLEVADGLFQPETHRIITNDEIMGNVSVIIFAAADSVGAYGGCAVLKRLGQAPHFLGGLFTASRLKIDEVASWCRIPVLSIASENRGIFVDFVRKAHRNG